jgi:glucan phosphoethanolaminetransferase (alkaline phosphatase superfamily)
VGIVCATIPAAFGRHCLWNTTTNRESIVNARQTIVRLLLATSVTASGLMSACGGKDADPQLTDRSTNVILISIDTLRPDHLGCYGYGRDTSPALDRLCQDAVVFEEAIAQAPSTLHSHASMLTSLLPHHHLAT